MATICCTTIWTLQVDNPTTLANRNPYQMVVATLAIWIILTLLISSSTSIWWRRCLWRWQPLLCPWVTCKRSLVTRPLLWGIIRTTTTIRQRNKRQELCWVLMKHLSSLRLSTRVVASLRLMASDFLTKVKEFCMVRGYLLHSIIVMLLMNSKIDYKGIKDRNWCHKAVLADINKTLITMSPIN